MIERREKLKQEIKEVAERLEVTLSEYRLRYYKEMPVNSRKKILKYLKGANIETELLLFENKIQKYMYFSELIESNSKTKDIINNICQYIENTVNELLKYYNEEFGNIVFEFINSIIYNLEKNEYKIDGKIYGLSNRLVVSNCILLYEEKYPDLVELKNIISIITDIDSIQPGTLTPDTHELYGVKTLLLELEEKIKIIESMEDSSCVNVILEYIDSLIDWNWFKEIR